MKSLLTFILILSSASVFGQKAEFSFNKSVWKFPKTHEGEILTHYYTFTNTGNAPLVIASYDVECHCTELDFPDYPIPPGATDSVKVTFNTKGKYFNQERSVIITSNAKKAQTVIWFKGYVIPKED